MPRFAAKLLQRAAQAESLSGCHFFASRPKLLRRGAGAVERGGLENRCAFTGTVGSNPTLSASLLRMKAEGRNGSAVRMCRGSHRSLSHFRLSYFELPPCAFCVALRWAQYAFLAWLNFFFVAAETGRFLADAAPTDLAAAAGRPRRCAPEP